MARTTRPWRVHGPITGKSVQSFSTEAKAMTCAIEEARNAPTGTHWVVEYNNGFDRFYRVCAVDKFMAWEVRIKWFTKGHDHDVLGVTK